MRWHLNKPAYDVQTEALRRSEGHGGFLFWCEPGCGKTNIVWNEYVELRQRGVVDAIVIVTLNSFRTGWLIMAQEFGVEGKFAVWPDCQKLRPDYLDGVVINYEALIHSGGEWITKFMVGKKVYLAFDESHTIKNPNSKVTRWANNLWKDAVVRRGLTGTPMAGNVVDLFPQLKLAGELNGMNSAIFRARYAERGGYKGKQVVGIKEERLPELEAIFERCAFRARKDDWLDLPEKTYMEPIRVAMPKGLLARYRQMQQDFVLELDAATVITADMVMGQMLKLQQISSGFIFDEEHKVHQLIKLSEHPKYAALGDVVASTIEGGKMVIFTHFVPTTQYVEFYLDKALGVHPLVMKAGMKDDELAKLKKEFNSDGGSRVLVAQSSVGSATHTFLGGSVVRCNTVAFFENDYQMIKRVQAEDRIHRIGQVNRCLYYDFACSAAEMAPILALQRKKDLVAAIIDGIRSK